MKTSTVSFILLLFSFVFHASAEELRFNTQDFPPFSYLERGEVAGPAAAIIRAVCKEINVHCTFKLMVWKDAQEEVRQGKAHGMFVIGWNRKRSDWLYFSPRITQTEYGFFTTKKDDLQLNQIEDIAGYRVGVYGPSNTSRSLERIQKQLARNHALDPMTIRVESDDTIVFKALNSGGRNLSAVFSNKDVGNSIIRKNGLTNIRYAGTQRKLNYYIGFSRKFTGKALTTRFNKGYVKLYQQGVIRKISLSYSIVPPDIDASIERYYSE